MNFKLHIAHLLFAAVPTLAGAQDAGALRDCTQTLQTSPAAIKSVPLGLERDIVDGGAGRDVLVYRGPSHVVVGRGEIGSMERIDIQNGQFDTVTVLGEVVQATSSAEVDIRTDEFDTIVLDPRLSWTLLPDPSLAFDTYSATIDDKSLSVLVAPGTFVLFGQMSQDVTTVAGAEGEYAFPVPPSSETPQDIIDADGQAIFRWHNGGTIRPTVAETGLNVSEVDLDFANGKINFIELCLANVIDPSGRIIRFLADPFDQFVLLDPENWTRQDTEDPDVLRLSSETDAGSALVEMSAELLRLGSNDAVAVGFAREPGVWNLSSDSATALDAIDLRNGGIDRLILRNDGRIREGSRLIVGDPGDEIWLDGSAGWSIKYTPMGVTASNPVGTENSYITLLFGPDLKVQKLPFPPFLAKPTLLDLLFYPGSRDRVTEASTLFVTRGGYIDLSQIQIANKSTFSLRNGSPNILRIRPGDFSLAALRVDISGDSDADIVLAVGLPTPELTVPGEVSWTLPSADGPRTIAIRGLRIIYGDEVAP
jgi:hypothetical protein